MLDSQLPGRSRAEARRWLLERLSVTLGVDAGSIATQRPFADFGLSSGEALVLLGELEEWLGRTLPATLIWDHPTIEKLAEHLASSPAGRPDGPPAAATRPTAPPAITARQEPVAVIGVACRFPGAPSVEAFWDLLVNGRSGVGRVPDERWQAPDRLPHAVTQGGFLAEIDGFDAPFFAISSREAAHIDPQHRLVLEVAWEALVDAGVPSDSLAGSSTGVFTGIASNDYGRLGAADPSLLDIYSGTGNALSMAANRVSYWLDLRGPSMAVDTACSASLVAVDLACRSLLDETSELALAGGVNLLVSPDWSSVFERANMLSPDGRCKTFDAAADGYVRGEGCGLVVLKKLSRALADGDRVRAVILGSAVGQDGRTSGITAPSGPSQERVVREALRAAGVAPADIEYIEAHGTGTPLGDPIEIEALKAALELAGDGRAGAGQGPWIGSAKTNLGHLEAAAGIAGLIKTVLMIERGRIAPHLHFELLNPHLEAAGFPFRIPRQPVDWAAGTARLCGVSSFGFGGTNAHVIVAAPPKATAAPAGAPAPARNSARASAGGRQTLQLEDRASVAVSSREAAPAGDRGAGEGPLLVPLSAADSQALRQIAADLAGVAPALSLADIAHTASCRRGHLDQRLAIVAADSDELAARLAEWAEHGGGAAILPGIRAGRRAAAGAGPLAFVFGGQGGGWPGMGLELFEAEPAFRRAIGCAAEVIQARAGWRLIDELRRAPQAGATPRPEVDQPLLLALQVALVELLASRGLAPAAVVGHSLGEVAAAVVAGALDLEQGVEVALARGEAVRDGGLGGAMAAVGLAAADARRYLDERGDGLDIAAVNGPGSVVVSGEAAALDELLARLEADGVRVSRLATDYASHGPPMDEPSRRLAERLATLRPGDTKLPFVSTVEGATLAGRDLGGEYWRRNLRQPVLFERAIARLAAEGFGAFVEIGPHPMLRGPLRECLGDAAVIAAPMRRDGGREAFLAAIGEIWCAGVAVDWRASDGGGRLISLPPYPFQRRRCWIGGDTTATGSEPWERTLEEARRQAQRGPLDLDVGAWPERWEALDRLAEAYIRRTLDELERRFPGSARSADRLVEEAGVLPAYRQLMERWTSIAPRRQRRRDAGPTRVRASRPRRPSVPALIDTPAAGAGDIAHLEEKARMALAGSEFLLDYVVRCGERLTDVIRGRANALETLFPDSSYATVESLYHDWPVARYANDIAAAAVRQWAAAAGTGRPVRVLEVGAGTGGMTRSLLPVLGKDFSYLFTDVSELFFHRVRDRLRPWPQLDFAVLDLAQDPLAQGLTPGSFDIVVAANVLHATPNLARTLERVRWLLAPAGLLVVYEATTPFRWLDVSVALIEGWQAFDDELRQDSPLLDPAAWVRLLAEAGFDGVEALPTPDSAAAALGQTVLLARNAAGVAGGRSRDRWLRTVRWRPAPLPHPTIGATTEPATIHDTLVLDPGARLGEALAELRRGRRDEGAMSHRIASAEVDNAPEVAGARDEDDRGLASATAAALDWLDRRPPDRVADVVFIAAAYESPEATAGAESPDGAASDGASSDGSSTAGTPPGAAAFAALDLAERATSVSTRLLELGRALGERGRTGATTGAAAARLWVVTRRAHRLANDAPPPDAAGTALWGLGRVLASELGDAWGGLIDLEGVDAETDARQVAAELGAASLNPGPRVEAAWRGDCRFVPRLEHLAGPARSAAPGDESFRQSLSSGTVLIAGGTGELGLPAARMLVDRGARHLVLASRSAGAGDAGVDEDVAALRRRGAEVRLAAVDVADADAVVAVVAAIEADGWPPLRGIIHAAGRLDARSLAQTDAAFHRRVLRAKVQGACNLHAAAHALELDFFVLFSSASALFGLPGHASYATANAFLDGLAAQRRAVGLSGTSVAWGVWEVAGAAASGTVARYASLGLERIDVDAGVGALAALLEEAPPHVAVLPAGPEQWVRFAPEIAASPLLAATMPAAVPPTATSRGTATPRLATVPRDGAVLGSAATSPPASASAAPDDLVDAVRTADGDARGALVEQLVRERIAAVLHLPPDRVDARRSLFDLGFDSLMALDLKGRLEGDLGIELPVSRLLERPRLDAIAGIVLELWPPAGGDAAAETGTAGASGYETVRL